MRSAGARAEGWARGEGAGAHAEARAERRRDIAQEIAAARAAAVVSDRAGGIGAEPVAAGIAQRIDALHGETGQILHVRSLSGQPALRAHCRTSAAEAPLGGPDRLAGADSAVPRLWCQEKRLQGVVVGLRRGQSGACFGIFRFGYAERSWRERTKKAETRSAALRAM